MVAGSCKRGPKKVFRTWCPLGLWETTFKGCTGPENQADITKRQPRAPKNGSRYQALQKEEESPKSEDRTCMVCGVDDEKLTREAQLEFYDTDVGKLASGVRFLGFFGFRFQCF